MGDISVKWYELVQHKGKTKSVYDVYHCTELEIRKRAEQYTIQAANGIYYTYEEV